MFFLDSEEEIKKHTYRKDRQAEEEDEFPSLLIDFEGMIIVLLLG